MNFNKKYLTRGIAKNANINIEDSRLILESFLSLVKNRSKISIVKLSSFGTFSFKKSPTRIGRNPKTKESYIIPTMEKLNFRPSNITKKRFN